MRVRSMRSGACAALVVCAAGAAHAQTLSAVAVATGLIRPLYACAPPGDTNRLFICEQRGSGGVATQGYIKILNLRTGAVNATPFLAVTGLSTGSEQGLLGMAFSPNYATDGFFYVSYTNSGGTSIISRYHVSADPDVADPASATNVISVAQPFSNHNGGCIQFGPDGYLYFGLGDGGSEGDPQHTGQNLNTLLSKMLRIDVSTLPYTVPPTNPYVGMANIRPEIWAVGLRNPWRFSFDRATGDLWIGDVGQDTWEEIDFQRRLIDPPFPAQNYGWSCYEGNVTYNLGQTCPPMNAVHFPVQVYQHLSGLCSVTGGYVYRGCAIPWLRGTYFYSDYCAHRTWSFRYDGTTQSEFVERTTELVPTGGTLSTITSWGEDGNGELYICGGSIVAKVIARCPANCDGSTTSPVLNINDFLCFQTKFAQGDCYANCDGSSTPPVLNVNDFLCFQQQFASSNCP